MKHWLKILKHFEKKRKILKKIQNFWEKIEKWLKTRKILGKMVKNSKNYKKKSKKKKLKNSTNVEIFQDFFEKLYKCKTFWKVRKKNFCFWFFCLTNSNRFFCKIREFSKFQFLRMLTRSAGYFLTSTHLRRLGTSPIYAKKQTRQQIKAKKNRRVVEALPTILSRRVFLTFYLFFFI